MYLEQLREKLVKYAAALRFEAEEPAEWQKTLGEYSTFYLALIHVGLENPAVVLTVGWYSPSSAELRIHGKA